MEQAPLGTAGPGSDHGRARKSLSGVRAAISHTPGLLPRLRPFLDRLGELQLATPENLEAFVTDRFERLREYTTEERLGQALVQAGLLTAYQLDRVLAGATHGLVLGNYRVLEEIGQGGMGVVYRAEHRVMRRQVAVKVLPVDDGCPASVLQRFYAEMRVLAELQDPNVVLALDAGELDSPGPDAPQLVYLVMELVDGGDLEKRVVREGPCTISEGCDYIRQAARGLQACHDRHLIHRDLKPSNLLLGSAGQIKLVDFGLARQFCSRLTDQRALLGSVEFMPPEQSHDPSLVGPEADVYGLGATLFWLLTGEGPYPHASHVGTALRVLQREQPRRLRSLLPDAPEALDALVAQMLDRDPRRRPPSARAVYNALGEALGTGHWAFVGGRAGCPADLRRGLHPSPPTPTAQLMPNAQCLMPKRVLIVDDESRVRLLLRSVMQEVGCECVEAASGAEALDEVARSSFDLVLLDLVLRDIDGMEVLTRLRQRADNPHLKILVVSGKGSEEELSSTLAAGADDFLAKPFARARLRARAERMLALKEGQDRADRVAEQLLRANLQLEQSLAARVADLHEAHNAILFSMAKMAESGDGETAGHLRRMQLYARTLAQESSFAPPWAGLVNQRFLEQLERCVPLHDIGKIGLPDDILLKPASLSPSERLLMQTHPVIGDKMLEALASEYGNALDFLGMARVIVRHHHERHDGKGYPDRLAGSAIPPAARVVALCDVYDALRRMRMYKPSMTHSATVRTILEGSPGQFDPALMQAFARCQEQFERIYREIGD